METPALPAQLPRQGELLYIPSAYFIGHGEDDVIGGLAVIENVRGSFLINFPNTEQPQWCYVGFTNDPGTLYNFACIWEEQLELYRKHGMKWAYPQPSKRSVPSRETVRVREEILNEWAPPTMDRLFAPLRELIEGEGSGT